MLDWNSCPEFLFPLWRDSTIRHIIIIIILFYLFASFVFPSKKYLNNINK